MTIVKAQRSQSVKNNANLEMGELDSTHAESFSLGLTVGWKRDYYFTVNAPCVSIGAGSLSEALATRDERLKMYPNEKVEIWEVEYIGEGYAPPTITSTRLR